MTCVPMRLECTGLETLPLDVGEILAATLDLGDAETRVVTMNAPGADGTFDTTAFTGARTITLQLVVDSTSSASTRLALTNKLRAFSNPRLRPTLYFQLAAGDPEMCVTLRRGPFSDRLNANTLVRNKVTAQWVAPLGIIESAAQHTAVAYAAGTVTAGRTYPVTYPRTYPASQALGAVTVTNAGTADAYPTIRMYGPATEPVFDNQTQGKSLTFVGLTLNTGEYLDIDMRAKTIYLNGDSSNSRYSKLSFPTSQWWTLSPGVNTLRFHPATFTEATTNATVIWRDAWL